MSANQLIVIFGLVALSNGQTLQEGSCNASVAPITDFDALAYLGLWYENARSPLAYEEGGSCITARYSLNVNGTVQVVNTQNMNDSVSTIEGYATFNQGPTVGSLAVTFPGVPIAGSYNILATNYISYASVYGCQNGNNNNSYVNMWLLTRERKPSQETVNTGYAAFDYYGLDTSLITPTDQSNCG